MKREAVWGPKGGGLPALKNQSRSKKKTGSHLGLAGERPGEVRNGSGRKIQKKRGTESLVGEGFSIFLRNTKGKGINKEQIHTEWRKKSLN